MITIIRRAQSFMDTLHHDRSNTTATLSRTFPIRAICQRPSEISIWHDMILDNHLRVGIREHLYGFSRSNKNFYHKECLSPDSFDQLYLKHGDTADVEERL